jgi:hypothetical protein
MGGLLAVPKIKFQAVVALQILPDVRLVQVLAGVLTTQIWRFFCNTVCVCNFELKGSVSRDVRGVKSGINREVFL